MTRLVTRLLLSWCLLGTLGCAGKAPSHLQLDTHILFNDAAFKQEVRVPSVEDIFALPAEARAEVKRGFDSQKLMHGNGLMANEWLAQYLNASNGGFNYRDNFTRVASETFNSREGNCMSLVVLTTALADILKLNVEWQDIDVQPVWDKQGDFYLINGHVNLRLLPPSNLDTVHVMTRAILVDFLPARAERGYNKKTISKKTLIAMFYNNLAAESMVQGDYDTAYALVKAGILQQPDFIPAYNTLAVIYRRNHDERRAEQVYRYVLALEPHNMTTLYNLAMILGSQGRLEEWAEVHKVLELARINNPYYYYDIAEQAYEAQEYQEALVWFRRAVEKAGYRHEFYFGLSKAYWATGDQVRARKNMEKALALSSDPGNKHRYQLKLEAMKYH
ncbi:tetratricopeptide repeat protein [Shewanella salipaludis]|uniref:Tetratricopeptide repeat protein n=1 Tax=Shewanella salipaludis TaxID=2723052 RepID=A0A972JMS8_9GAMM|nr:hypothetical protein [Shewanella salipaludis]NMH65436.1 hypothetical protein [Shewanella salipaludis]